LSISGSGPACTHWWSVHEYFSYSPFWLPCWTLS
jgi:hypothetical protein